MTIIAIFHQQVLLFCLHQTRYIKNCRWSETKQNTWIEQKSSTSHSHSYDPDISSHTVCSHVYHLPHAAAADSRSSLPAGGAPARGHVTPPMVATFRHAEVRFEASPRRSQDPLSVSLRSSLWRWYGTIGLRHSSARRYSQWHGRCLTLLFLRVLFAREGEMTFKR